MSGRDSVAKLDAFTVVTERRFGGADPTGVADSTAAIEAALAAGGTVHLPPGTFILGNIVPTVSVRVVGAGKGATTIKWKASSAEDSLFKFTTAGIRIEFEHLTIDGNKANQTDSTGYYGAIYCTGNGTSLALRHVRFTNGRIGDVRVAGPTTTGHVAYLTIEDCEFDNGMAGTLTRVAHYVIATDHVVCTFTNNRASMPASQTIGRAGFLLQRAAGSTGTDFGKYIATGNVFDWVGRGVGVADTLGCLDVYSGGEQIVVTGNIFSNVMGRAIDVKADSGDVVIAHNSVKKHYGDIPAIVLFGQASTVSASRGRNAIVSHNIVQEAQNSPSSSGIFIDGDDTNTDFFESVTVEGNIIDYVLQRGLYIKNIKRLTVKGNKVTRSGRGIFAENPGPGRIVFTANEVSDCTDGGLIVGTATDADVVIRGNVFEDNDTDIGLYSAVNSFDIRDNKSSGAATFIDINGSTDPSWIIGNDGGDATDLLAKAGTYGTLTWRDNYGDNPLSYAERALTIDTGAITIWADFHWVDTEASAATDTLSTINGGYDGRRVVLCSANAARDITIDEAGNVIVPGASIDLNNPSDKVDLMYKTSTSDYWFVVSFSDNAA